MNAIKIAYVFEPTSSMTSYSLERAKLLQQHWNGPFHLFSRQPVPGFDHVTLYQTTPELLEALRNEQPSLLLRDAGRSSVQDIQLFKQLGCAVGVIDDTGDGAPYADYQLQTLFTEEFDDSCEHFRKGIDAFIPTAFIPPAVDPNRTKRVVVAFPERDPDNLTYRVLRHITSLHVPVEVDVLIHPDYEHDIFALQSFILQRKSIQLIETRDFMSHLSRADLAITSASHMPYLCVQTATPAVLLAESKAEVAYQFADEIPAFIHLGLGRKIKQSALQNTIMEVLLHDSLLEKRKQQLQKMGATSPLASILEELRQLAEQREFTS